MTKTRGWLLIALLIGLPLPSSTGSVARDADAVDDQVALQPTPLEWGQWHTLFDGVTLAGWRAWRGDRIEGWTATDGVLARTGSGGDIVTVRRFGDFEFAFEWRVDRGANSGVFYRADPNQRHIYMSAPEYQVLDDAHHRDGRDPLTSAGSNFGLYPAPRGVVRPAGEWNEGRIVAHGERIEHWLNGVRVVAYELDDADWQARVTASKFAAWPAYGRAREGHIGLQDHGDPVAFRSLRIRELGGSEQVR
jgi:hypothetical protein